tara:strand:- start:644 stop:2428 length:1785 start_codon:yes stop_codon:yes gene_type:complete
MEVPDGGLATFLTATVGDWADDNEGYIPPSGIGGVKSVADKLAEYGRYEDTYMVHAAEGETVIPMAVFDENPRLKETLFNQMRSMGIDPEQYVVGSELNSINPVTGQPEFFLKKLFRGLKKAVKKVVKVIKKVAPIALSIGLSFTPLGAIAGSALGSGIGTLIQGGSLKDALKMGAIGGLTAGLFKGVTGGIGSKMQGGTFGSGFKAGIQSGLPDAMRASQAAALNQTAAQAANQALPPAQVPAGSTTVQPPANVPGANLSGADTAQKLARQAPIDQVRPDMQQTITAPRLQTVSATPPVKQISSPLPQDSFFYEQNAVFDPNAAAKVTPPTLEDALVKMQEDAAAGTAGEAAARGITGTQVGQRTAAGFDPESLRRPGFMESVKDMFDGGGNFVDAAKDVFFPGKVDRMQYIREMLGLPETAGKAAIEQASGQSLGDLLTQVSVEIGEQGLNPNFLRRFGPAAGAGLGILGLTGGFEGEDIPVPEDPFGLEGQSAFDLLAADPQKYRVFYSGGPYNLGGKPYGAAAGGSTDDFPRRDGAIAGPGTGTSDDIPAMLSDGEFVMTAQAVRGAGNGDRKKGVRKMYEIMRTYEGVA